MCRFSPLRPWTASIFLLRRRKDAKKHGFIGFFAKTALFAENENQLQKPVFETFAKNIAAQYPKILKTFIFF